jgi:hypothetical protein
VRRSEGFRLAHPFILYDDEAVKSCRRLFHLGTHCFRSWTTAFLRNRLAKQIAAPVVMLLPSILELDFMNHESCPIAMRTQFQRDAALHWIGLSNAILLYCMRIGVRNDSIRSPSLIW